MIKKETNLPVFRLQRTLSSVETWGFGLSGLLLWLGVAPAMNMALGSQAIWVWIPGTITGILLNLQVKRLGIAWPKMAGGTPNYASRLLRNYPFFARYGALGYWLGWVSVPTMNAIILTDLIRANLELLGVATPELFLRIFFTVLAYIVAFSGTRALGILHLCFVIPAIGFLIAFCVQGLSWLAFSQGSPGFFVSSSSQAIESNFNLIEWAKWYFMAVYAVNGCETASSFVADSKKPTQTLKILPVTASLIPLIYVGGSWLLIRLATAANLENNTFLQMFAVAHPFWGRLTGPVLTFLLTCSCLLSCSTAVSNSPRVLYQLSLDGYISPVFSVISRRGVLEPALLLTLFLSLICLTWGNMDRIVMITGTGYLCSIIFFHLGLALNGQKKESLWSNYSGLFCLIEIIVLVIGGIAWGWKDLLLGLSLPVLLLLADKFINTLNFPPFHPHWWLNIYRSRSGKKHYDFILPQIGILILLVCSALTFGWFLGTYFDQSLSKINYAVHESLLVISLVTIAFVAVGIACWTTLPQIASIIEAQQTREHLFKTTLDGMIILDENGIILSANPASETLFNFMNTPLTGLSFNSLIKSLSPSPSSWPSRSEHILKIKGKRPFFIEVAISRRFHWDSYQYMAIIRNITTQKITQKVLERSERRERKKALVLETTLEKLRKTQTQLIQSEKMSSLGQLVAGVAHEINNPVNFIYGNILHLNEYVKNLLEIMALYQKNYPNPPSEITQSIQELDLDFIIEDIQQILRSMEVGSERIRKIVLTLRNFSRLDEAEMKFVNIHEGIDSALLILQNNLKAKPNFPGVKVEKIYGDLPAVECYPGQLNQVFMNLLTNAIDAMVDRYKNRSQMEKKGGNSAEFSEDYPRITIITESEESEGIKIKIRDNGSGIPPAIMSRIFDPFFTTKQVGEGTGLGLAISYQIIVEKHQGTLQCSSVEGEGTEFVISIPQRQVTALTVDS